MMKFDNVRLPDELLDQHMVVLGKTRSGKSSVFRLFVELLLKRGERVAVVDPKGDWFGLKLARDGKSPGFPVVAFGDFKEPKATDVPIRAEAAGQVAELIATGKRPCVIGLRGWMPRDLTTFWINFASTLFNRNKAPLYLVVDEVHNFAPKGKILDVDAGKCLHWSNRLASEGLGLGIRMLIASQRPQKVHNDTLTSCETLIAMRVVHEADREALKSWIDGCGDKAHGTAVLNTLAAMNRGEGWVWSPEAGFGPERIQFPMFATYDSFAEPKGGSRRNLKGWAAVNLDDVKAKLAAVVEQAKQDDPKELKKRIAELLAENKKLAAAAAKPAAGPAKRVEVPIVKESQVKQITKAVDAVTSTANSIDRLMDRFVSSADQLRNALARVNGAAMPPRPWNGRPAAPRQPPTAVKPPADKPAKRPTSEPSALYADDDGPLTKSQYACLRAAYWIRDEEPTTKKLAFYADQSVTSSAYERALARLRRSGLIVGLSITDAGIAALGDVAERPSGSELRAWLRPKLNPTENAILDALIDVYPQRLSPTEIAEATAKSESSSAFERALATLRKIEAVHGGAKEGVAADAVLVG